FVDKALPLAGATAAFIAAPLDPYAPKSDTAELVVTETAGMPSVPSTQAVIPVDGTAVGEVFLDGTPRRLDALDLTIGTADESGPALVLPVRMSDMVVSVLVISRCAGSPPFTAEQLDMMAALTDHAAVAWQLGMAQRRMRRFEVLTDRDRIAGELHDHVIHRLFAIGLAMQATLPLTRSPEVQRRLAASVDDVQEVVREIRTAIFDLDAASSGVTRLWQRLQDAIAQFSGDGRRTTVQFVGPMSAVSAALADHAEAVLQQAVRNVIRHAHATRLSVTVSVDDALCIEVVDDGRGTTDEVVDSALTDLRRRADKVGGTLRVEGTPDGGTLLRWSAPLSR
ncbi:MAG: sensor histidine kinase, partial [Mycobacterium sp.]